MDIANKMAGLAEGPKSRQFVTALARGLEVLRVFGPGDVVLSNQELAERTGLPKPTVSRLTHTLCALGYLTCSTRTGGYQLGPGVLSLGYAMIAGLEIRERARPLMKELAMEIGASVALGSRDRLSVVYLDICQSAEAITLRLSLGSRVPLMKTSIGRAIMAALPDREREFLLRAARDREPNEFRAIEAGIERACREVEEFGFCTSFGAWRPEVNAVGVPVMSLDGEHLYAINCGGPSFTLTEKKLMEEAGPKLLTLARSLSADPRAFRRAARA